MQALKRMKTEVVLFLVALSIIASIMIPAAHALLWSAPETEQLSAFLFTLSLLLIGGCLLSTYCEFSEPADDGRYRRFV